MGKMAEVEIREKKFLQEFRRNYYPTKIRHKNSEVFPQNFSTCMQVRKNVGDLPDVCIELLGISPDFIQVPIKFRCF